MAGASDYLENKILDHVFGGSDYSRPGTLYLAAFTATPNDAGSGTEVSSSNNYSRKAVTNNGTNFPSASARLKGNGVAIPFPTASGSWGTITAIGIYDAASGGNLLAVCPLNSSQAIGNGDTLNLDIGALSITWASGGFSDYLANAMLDHVFGGGNYTRPSTLYYGALTSPSSDSAAGSEPSGGSYARASVTNNTTNFPNASSGNKTNGVAVSFPTATANWGTLSYWAIFDAASSGNLLAYGSLSASKSAPANSTPLIAASALSIGQD